MNSGLSAFLLTPADSAGNVDTPALLRLARRLGTAGIDSLGVLGSTGTYMYFSRDQRRRALDAVLQENSAGLPVLAGIGALRTDEALACAIDARDAGASAGLLAAVSYTPLTNHEVGEHYRTIAARSRLPLCIYDNPSTTRFAFTPALIGELSRVPGIVALKSPAPETGTTKAHLSGLRAAVPPGFSLGYSGDWCCTEALLAGADCWYSVLAGLLPAPCVAIVAAVRRGDVARACQVDAQLAPLWALFRRHGSLRVCYALADDLGLCKAEPPRPILPLAEAERREVKAALQALPPEFVS